jgi:hypothetical protein
MSEEIEIKETKCIKAKTASLWGQIIAAVWVGGWCSVQNIKDIIAGNHIDIKEIIFSGLAIAACFSPIYFNLIMDKIKEIKLGGE